MSQPAPPPPSDVPPPPPPPPRGPIPVAPRGPAPPRGPPPRGIPISTNQRGGMPSSSHVAPPPGARPPSGAPPSAFPPSNSPSSGARPPSARPPGARPPKGSPPPPQARPPSARPPSASPPNARPPRGSPPGARPPSASPPNARPPRGSPPNARPPSAAPPNARPPSASPPNARPPRGSPPNARPPSASPPNARPPSASPPNARPPSDRPPSAVPQSSRPSAQVPGHAGAAIGVSTSDDRNSRSLPQPPNSQPPPPPPGAGAGAENSQPTVAGDDEAGSRAAARDRNDSEQDEWKDLDISITPKNTTLGVSEPKPRAISWKDMKDSSAEQDEEHTEKHSTEARSIEHAPSREAPNSEEAIAPLDKGESRAEAMSLEDEPEQSEAKDFREPDSEEGSNQARADAAASANAAVARGKDALLEKLSGAEDNTQHESKKPTGHRLLSPPGTTDPGPFSFEKSPEYEKCQEQVIEYRKQVQAYYERARQAVKQGQITEDAADSIMRNYEEKARRYEADMYSYAKQMYMARITSTQGDATQSSEVQSHAKEALEQEPEEQKAQASTNPQEGKEGVEDNDDKVQDQDQALRGQRPDQDGQQLPTRSLLQRRSPPKPMQQLMMHDDEISPVANDLSVRAYVHQLRSLPPNATVFEGFMRKQGQERGSWKRRWFVLQKMSLKYFKRSDSEKCQGSISTGIINQIRTVASTPTTFVFQLITPGRVYFLQAPTQQALENWLRALTSVVLFARSSNASPAVVQRDVPIQDERTGVSKSPTKQTEKAPEAQPLRSPDRSAGGVVAERPPIRLLSPDSPKHTMREARLYQSPRNGSVSPNNVGASSGPPGLLSPALQALANDEEQKGNSGGETKPSSPSQQSPYEISEVERERARAFAEGYKRGRQDTELMKKQAKEVAGDAPKVSLADPTFDDDTASHRNAEAAKEAKHDRAAPEAEGPASSQPAPLSSAKQESETTEESNDPRQQAKRLAKEAMEAVAGMSDSEDEGGATEPAARDSTPYDRNDTDEGSEPREEGSDGESEEDAEHNPYATAKTRIFAPTFSSKTREETIRSRFGSPSHSRSPSRSPRKPSQPSTKAPKPAKVPSSGYAQGKPAHKAPAVRKKARAAAPAAQRTPPKTGYAHQSRSTPPREVISPQNKTPQDMVRALNASASPPIRSRSREPSPKHVPTKKSAAPQRSQAKSRPSLAVAPGVYLPFVAQWINSLGLDTEVTGSNIIEKFKDGSLLCRILQHLIPDANLTGVTPKPRSKRPALLNLEKGLALVMRHRLLGGKRTTGALQSSEDTGSSAWSRIPSADDIYNGVTERVRPFLLYLFENLGLRPARRHASALLRWTQRIAAAYRAPVASIRPRQDAGAEEEDNTAPPPEGTVDPDTVVGSIPAGPVGLAHSPKKRPTNNRGMESAGNATWAAGLRGKQRRQSVNDSASTSDASGVKLAWNGLWPELSNGVVWGAIAHWYSQSENAVDGLGSGVALPRFTRHPSSMGELVRNLEMAFGALRKLGVPLLLNETAVSQRSTLRGWTWGGAGPLPHGHRPAGQTKATQVFLDDITLLQLSLVHDTLCRLSEPPGLGEQVPEELWQNNNPDIPALLPSAVAAITDEESHMRRHAPPHPQVESALITEEKEPLPLPVPHEPREPADAVPKEEAKERLRLFAIAMQAWPRLPHRNNPDLLRTVAWEWACAKAKRAASSPTTGGSSVDGTALEDEPLAAGGPSFVEAALPEPKQEHENKQLQEERFAEHYPKALESKERQEEEEEVVTLRGFQPFASSFRPSTEVSPTKALSFEQRSPAAASSPREPSQDIVPRDWSVNPYQLAVRDLPSIDSLSLSLTMGSSNAQRMFDYRGSQPPSAPNSALTTPRDVPHNAQPTTAASAAAPTTLNPPAHSTSEYSFAIEQAVSAVASFAAQQQPTTSVPDHPFAARQQAPHTAEAASPTPRRTPSATHTASDRAHTSVPATVDMPLNAMAQEEARQWLVMAEESRREGYPFDVPPRPLRHLFSLPEQLSQLGSPEGAKTLEGSSAPYRSAYSSAPSSPASTHSPLRMSHLGAAAQGPQGPASTQGPTEVPALLQMRDGFGKVIVSVENKDDPAASRIVWRKGSSFFPAEEGEVFLKDIATVSSDTTHIENRDRPYVVLRLASDRLRTAKRTGFMLQIVLCSDAREDDGKFEAWVNAIQSVHAAATSDSATRRH